MSSPSFLSSFEDALVSNRVDALRILHSDSQLSEPQKAVTAQAIALLDGNIDTVLASENNLRLLAPVLDAKEAAAFRAIDWNTALLASARSFVQNSNDNIAAQATVLLLGVASLNDFTANNYTGPPTFDTRMLTSAGWDETWQKQAQDLATQKLRMDGEDVYEYSYHPLSLLIARSLFLGSFTAASPVIEMESIIPASKSLAYWSMRYARVHQDLLDQNTATLKSFTDVVIPKAQARYCPPTPTPDAASSTSGSDATDDVVAPTDFAGFDHLISTQFYLEAAHIHQTYWSYKAIEECLLGAQNALGAKIELTGVMGKRTKWQKHEQAQLVVKVTHTEKRAKELTDALSTETAVSKNPLLKELLPHHLNMDSDVLLEKVALNEEQTETALGVEELALLLSLYEHHRKTRSQHITRDEEMMGYVMRALEESRSQRLHNRSWALECAALFNRSVLECTDKHAQDRALQQLEELSALFDRLHAPTIVASFSELADSKPIESYSRVDVLRVRMKDVWRANYPSIWTMKQGIGATFQTIGLYKSALDLFHSISYYDGVIESCMLLGKITEAENLIRQQLENKPNDPKLLCLLADCTRDISYYEKAWEVSNQSYPRAQRSLANFKMQRHLHAEAIPHFQLALDINPVFPHEWYAMGWCAMQINNYEVAATAFSRTVSFDPDYANAWNNLAAAHLSLKNKSAGFNALEQAVKFKTDSWKLWENYMVTAVDLHEYGKAVSAMEKIASLKVGLNTTGEKEARSEAEEKSGSAGKNIIDEPVLTILCRVVIDTAKSDGPNAFLVNRFLQMLTSVSQHVVNNALLYSCFADVYDVKGDKEKAIAMREKQVRFLQEPGWTEKIERIQAVVDGHLQLIEVYLTSNTKSNLMAGKFSLDTLVGKLKKLPLCDEEPGKQCIRQLEGMLQRIAQAQQGSSSSSSSAAAATGSAASSNMSIWR